MSAQRLVAYAKAVRSWVAMDDDDELVGWNRLTAKGGNSVAAPARRRGVAARVLVPTGGWANGPSGASTLVLDTMMGNEASERVAQNARSRP